MSYWPGVRGGAGVLGATRSSAWVLGDGTPVVTVTGYAGGIALDHVEPVPAHIVEAFAQGVTVDQIMTEDWDGDPYFAGDTR